MRIYEELFIVLPGTPEEEIDAIIGQLSTVITTAGGTVEKIDKWGVRRLAYRVQKHGEGYFVLLHFKCDANVVKEVERRLRVTDQVIKFLTVRMDEKLKWLEKRKKARAKRAAKRPAPAIAAPAAPAAPIAPAMPAAEEAAPPAPGAPAVEQSAE
jgi:small subunit ribosomal protein S6